MFRIRTIALVLFLLLVRLSPAGEHDFLSITHYSDALQREKTFEVYVPKAEEPANRFPVLFVLHGAYGSQVDWPTNTQIKAIADEYRMILVFPDGSPFGWYVNSPVEKDMQYETYVAEELPAEIDRLFPTVPSPDARGIMGLSMGGHGALLLAAKHPDVFGSASSLSGILRLTNHPDRWHIAGRLGSFGENREAWDANSVWEQAERFKDAGVELLFDCGVDDTSTGAIGDGRELHERLVSLGVPHIWREHEGTHSWKYWDTHLRDHLNFHQATMADHSPQHGWAWPRYFGRMKEFFAENAAMSLETQTHEEPTVVLLGSSSIQGLKPELFPGYRVINRGISGDLLGVADRGLSNRMEVSVFDLRPQFVVIKSGRNDLGDQARNGTPSIQQMIEEYEAILTTIKTRLPKTQVVVTTCAPVRGKYAHLKLPIVSYNNELKILCRRLEVPFVDLHKALVDNDGLLKEEYSRDGLHLTEAGDVLWAEMLNTKMAELAASTRKQAEDRHEDDGS
ncbi:MAG: hypothetical protein PWP23_2497 [Candidatus Sumerlaeota bacterium]|nr:hypothetical protein [Candidatus Sumerlaeota bacterium]